MILPPNVSNRPDTLFPYPPLLRAPAEAHRIDITADVCAALARIAPDIVIHTTGPFQAQDHDVAKACIAQGCHYLDLIKSISRRSDSCFSGRSEEHTSEIQSLMRNSSACFCLTKKK